MFKTFDIKKIFEDTQSIITGSHFVYAKKPDGWYHGDTYVNKDAIYTRPRFVSWLCQSLAMLFRERKIEVVVGPTVGAVNLATWTAHWLTHFNQDGVSREIFAVCADEEEVVKSRELSGLEMLDVLRLGGTVSFIASGNVIIEVCYTKEKGFPIPGIIAAKFLEKCGTRRVIKRGYDKVVKGKRCLIVEDIINSGLTVQKTKVAIEEAGGIVAGVGALCNRNCSKVTAATLGIAEFYSLLDLDLVMYPEADCPICKEKGRESVRTDLGKGKEFLARIGKTI